MAESQQGKLTGCLHAFTVCTPSKGSSGGAHTPKLMIKHQGRHNVAAGDGEERAEAALMVGEGIRVSGKDSLLKVSPPLCVCVCVYVGGGG